MDVAPDGPHAAWYRAQSEGGAEFADAFSKSIHNHRAEEIGEQLYKYVQFKHAG